MLRRAVVALAGVLILGAAPKAQERFDPAAAQWRVRTTEHFEIYYTQSRDLETIAHEAERAYAKVSGELRRQVSARVPMILLPTSRDLPHDTQAAAAIVQASGAPPRDHLLLPVNPRAGREKTLAHELTHIFEFDRR